jgi:hypothetical protein
MPEGWSRPVQVPVTRLGRGGLACDTHHLTFFGIHVYTAFSQEFLGKEPHMNVYISDLFFNMDVSECWDDEKGYDREMLETVAKSMLAMLHGLGVQNLPTANEVVDNFMERL